jgi:hypothetical protein
MRYILLIALLVSCESKHTHPHYHPHVNIKLEEYEDRLCRLEFMLGFKDNLCIDIVDLDD